MRRFDSPSGLDVAGRPNPDVFTPQSGQGSARSAHPQLQRSIAFGFVLASPLENKNKISGPGTDPGNRI
jgi:hypothetical protein